MRGMKQLLVMEENMSNLKKEIKGIAKIVSELSLDEKVEMLNFIKLEIHKISPFNNEPVDCVLWKKADNVIANDYNPNAVAPPEMKLLEHSVKEDGFTQPIVTWKEEKQKEVVEVIDGFHRNRVGKENKEINERIHGYLPIVIVNNDRVDRNDRIASTIRHNRARGKHKIDAMSEIVLELKRRNWSDKKIGIELGMDQDEVLRLVQITGLAEMFADREFSMAWEAEKLDESQFEGDYETLD